MKSMNASVVASAFALVSLVACTAATDDPAKPSGGSSTGIGEGPAPTATATGTATSTAPGRPPAPPKEDDPDMPPVAVVDKLLVSIEGARPTGNLRVTTVWMTVPSAPVPAIDPFVVSADVGVPASLAQIVEIPLISPPTSARMLSADGSYTALGRVIVYDDQNGNGRFDLSPAATATAFADRIVGYVGTRTPNATTGRDDTATYGIGYVHGKLPTDGIFAGATLGYSVVHSKESGGPVTQTLFPLTKVVPAKLVAEPALSCAGVSPLPSGSQGGLRLDGVVPAPITLACPGNAPLAGAVVSCAGPLNFYVSRLVLPTSPFVTAACGPAAASCVVSANPAAPPGPLVGAPPAGWPCP